MRGFLVDWERYWIEVHDFETPAPGRYLATVTQRGIGKRAGVEVTAPATIAVTVRDGLIVQLEWWLDREDAVAALERFAP